MPQQLKTCARKTMDDEFYTLYRDCVRELHKYDLRDKRIICPCDTKQSNIYIYLKDCGLDVRQDSNEWRNVPYGRYDLVITNPPFSSVREMIRALIRMDIPFIMIVPDVLRWSIRKRGLHFDSPLWGGVGVQKFSRPDGSIVPIHCGWLASIPDDWGENKRLN